MAPSIVVKGLSKRFRRIRPDRPRTIQEAFLAGFRGLRRSERFWGLRDVSFHTEPGKMIGVIGRNGAGKSTLLRLIGGVGRPDEGTISVRGRISGLLSLGVGFHPDLTGRENAIIGGVLSGLTRREVKQRFDDIVDFAELHHCIDSPLRTYSNGMKMRLAFSVAIHTNPDVLLIDEVLAVGDVAFQSKCLHRIAQLKAAGTTIVLVSHSAEQVAELCDEAIWLELGKIHSQGPAAEVVKKYANDLDFETRRRTPRSHPDRRTSSGVLLRVHENRIGTMDVEITDVRMLGADGELTAEIERGTRLRVELDYQVRGKIHSPIFGITIVDQEGTPWYQTQADDPEVSPETLEGTGRLTVVIPTLPLDPGAYFLDPWVWEHNWTFGYEYHRQAHPLRVLPPTTAVELPETGLLGKMKSEWTRRSYHE